MAETVFIGGRKKFTAGGTSIEKEELREWRFSGWPLPFIGLPDVLLIDIDIDRGRFSDESSCGKCESECT